MKQQIESQFLVRHKVGKEVASPSFKNPMQANQWHIKNLGDSQAFEIVKVFSKKIICEHCGAEFERESYVNFKCPICHTIKVIC